MENTLLNVWERLWLLPSFLKIDESLLAFEGPSPSLTQYAIPQIELHIAHII